MTWQLASLALLVLALVAGFAWYERAHPSAKVLALVASLAALAVLGRVAFAAVPSVKPSLDLVLIAGYVLGGAPGFAVGAVGALASNVFFGQGPYTPWQMVGWGAIGLFGAALARVFGRDLGRVPLALACGVSGFALGAFLDLHLWVMYSGHSLGELGVLAARGLPFNLALAAGNVAFCLAFGPALVRALGRFRDRFEVDWRPAPASVPAPIATGLALAVVVGAVALAAPAPASADTGDRAVAYLRAAQVGSGGFASARGDASANALHSGWAAMALGSAGRCPSPATVRYLEAEGRRVREAGDLQRSVLALRAVGRSASGPARRLAALRRADGSWEGLVNATSFGVLALRAAGRPVGSASARWLARQQNDDGGFNFGGEGGPSGIDDTAAAMQALAAAGQARGAAVRRAAAWLARQQRPDGGFPLNTGAGSNAQSTAFAVQGLVAAGRDPDRVRRAGSRSPVAFLRTLQAPDGSIRYSRASRQTPTWVTAQALLALERDPLPAGPARSACPARAARPARTRLATPAPAPAADEPAAEPDAAPSRPRPRPVTGPGAGAGRAVGRRL